MSDQLGIFGRGDGETGELDVDELKAALSAGPVDAAVDPTPQARRPERADPRAAVRRHRRWLVFAVVVLVVIVAGLIAGFVFWRSTADAALRQVGSQPGPLGCVLA